MKIIDTLALIRKQIEKLEIKEGKVRDRIVARYGAGCFEGDNFSATIIIADRKNLDLSAVRAVLSERFLEAHSSTREVITVRTAAI